LFASRAQARVATPTDFAACEHPIAQAQGRNTGRNRYRGARVQRLEVLIAIMLARERRDPADAMADGCTALAAALATLPSRPLEMIAEAVAALGIKFDVERPSGAARNRASPPEVQRASGAAPKRERVPMKITAPDGRVRLWARFHPAPVTSRRRCALQFRLPIAQSLGCRW
jgi:hypothetical protein